MLIALLALRLQSTDGNKTKMADGAEGAERRGVGVMHGPGREAWLAQSHRVYRVAPTNGNRITRKWSGDSVNWICEQHCFQRERKESGYGSLTRYWTCLQPITGSLPSSGQGGSMVIHY